MRARPAAVAGAFYPADPKALRAAVDRFLSAAPGSEVPPKALIAPHAGYVYSGPIAGSAYACWKDGGTAIRRVVLLGPAHHARVASLAVPEAEAHRTPLGEVPHDAEAALRIARLPWVEQSDEALQREHSLEVQLPFLQVVLGDFTLVPIGVGNASRIDVADVLERLWGGPETAIVVSSDLSHQLPYADARRRDEATALTIEALEDVGEDDACGSHAVNGLLLAARRKGLKATRLDLRNSGDTAGDRRAVVGYGAWAFA